LNDAASFSGIYKRRPNQIVSDKSTAPYYLNSAFISTTIAKNQRLMRADKEQMHGVQSSKHLVIKPIIHRLLNLFVRAGIKVRNLERAKDFPALTISKSHTGLMLEFRKLHLETRLT